MWLFLTKPQRAWTRDELARFLADKTKGRTNVLKDFPYSEPEFLISTINRHEDWGVVICLIGGGQEINKGEAGIGEWVAAINRRYQDWDVYISDKLTGDEYEHGRMFDIVEKNTCTLSLVYILQFPCGLSAQKRFQLLFTIC